MAMWKPQGATDSDTRGLERQWAFTLTHEFTHAFVARYRTNRAMPRWLHEGLADYIAARQFPRTDRPQAAREMARRNDALDFLFNDDQLPGGEYYPVMQMMVTMLIEKSPQTFHQYFDAIKDGTRAEQALKQFYGFDYAGFLKVWRAWIEQ